MAASAIIDVGLVQRLITARLKTITAITTVPMGEPDPEDSDAWVRLTKYQLTPRRRQRRTDEPHHAGIIVELQVWTLGGATNQASSYAIGCAAAEVIAKFVDAALQDATVTHDVSFTECDVNVEADPDPERSLRVAVITLSGLVIRVSGTSIESHLT